MPNPSDERQSDVVPPTGYKSWLRYAIDTMETRDLFLDCCRGDSAWGRIVQREEMEQVAHKELDDVIARIAALEAENAELRRVLGELLDAGTSAEVMTTIPDGPEVDRWDKAKEKANHLLGRAS